MNATADWLEEHRAGEQQRFLSFVGASLVTHVAVVAVAAFVPAPPSAPMPEVVRVDLVSLPAPAAARPKARTKAQPAPAPAPAPVAKPRPQPKQVVLPKEAPAAVPKKPKARPTPRAVTPPARPEPIEYEDALSQLRAELGEETPAPATEATPTETPAEVAGVESIAAEAAAEATLWQRDVIRHLKSCWITPPEFLDGALSTGLEVKMTAGGGVLGEPTVFRGSGDPYFDENAARAVMRCAPLPAPPEAGSWRFNFTSETR